LITLVRDEGGDWIALYKDGKLVDQGHSFESSRLLTLLGIEHEEITDGNAEETGFTFPESLDEVVRYG
jgi:hypothetical protein